MKELIMDKMIEDGKIWRYRSLASYKETNRQQLLTKKTYYAVMDRETNYVIHINHMASVAKSVLDDVLGYKIIRLTQKRLKTEPNFDLNPWFYSIDSDGFLIRSTILPEKDLVERFSLYNERLYGIAFIQANFISSVKIENDVKTLIYQKKYEHAFKFLAGKTNYEETYYVHAWAELKEIDCKTAANEIIFNHENYMYTIFLSENLRHKFILRIKNASSIEEIYEIVNEYEVERYINAAI
jgi:hypothetical protein